jgi:hypothetical protein
MTLYRVVGTEKVTTIEEGLDKGYKMGDDCRREI